MMSSLYFDVDCCRFRIAITETLLALVHLKKHSPCKKLYAFLDGTVDWDIRSITV